VVGYGGSKGGGKKQSLDAQLLTSGGFIQLKNAKVGTKLLNPDGSEQKIIQLHPITEEEQYEFTFSDGRKIVSCKDHLWYGGWRRDKSDFMKSWDNPYCLKTSKEIYEYTLKERARGVRRLFKIPLSQNIEFEDKNIKIEPYLLGLLLGDGTITGRSDLKLTTSKEDFDDMLSQFGKYIEEVRYGNFKDKGIRDIIFRPRARDEIKKQLSEYGLLGKTSMDKFIPKEYRYSSRSTRLALLQGMMDTDGSIEKNGRAKYWTISRRLAKDFVWVARSLGFRASMVKRPQRDKIEGDKVYKCKPCYKIGIRATDNKLLFRLKRKRDRGHKAVTSLSISVVDVKIKKKVPMRCITVSHPNGLYITNDFIVTHNSWLVRAWMVSRRLKYPNTDGVIIRKTYPELLTNHIKMLWKEYPELKQYYKSADKCVEFPNGSTLYFRHLQHDSDVYNFRGQSFEDIALDEATEHTEETFQVLRSSNRLNEFKSEGEKIKPTMFLTFNPGGIGHQWVKRLFIDRRFFKNEKPRDYSFVQAFLRDNKILAEADPGYLATLKALPDHLRRAYLDGDWDVFEGQFFPEWNREVHVVRPRFEFKNLPSNWNYRLCWDEGTRAPRAAYVLIQDSDGYVDMVFEYYKAGELASVAAENIKTRLKDIGLLEILQKRGLFVFDPSMDINNNQTGLATSLVVSNILGIRMQKGTNNRVEGARRFREYLHYTEFQKPMLRVWDGCINFIRTLPQLIYADNREDCNSDTEDHCVSGESKIWTIQGKKKIKDLVGQTGYLYTRDNKIERFYDVKLTKVGTEMVRVNFADGSVECTPEHLFLEESGRWIKAIDLRPSHMIQSVHESKYNKRHNSRVRWNKILQLWQILPKKGETPTQDSMGISSWQDTERTSCSPQGLEQGKQSDRESTLSNGKRTSNQTSNDSKNISEEKTAHEKRNARKSKRMAQVKRGNRMASTTWKRNMEGQKTIYKTMSRMWYRLSNLFSKKVKILSPELQGKSYAKKVISVEKIANDDTYNLHVENTNCFAVNNGVIIHNSYDAVRYGLMSLTRLAGRLGGKIFKTTYGKATSYNPLGGYQRRVKKSKRPDWLPDD